MINKNTILLNICRKNDIGVVQQKANDQYKRLQQLIIQLMSVSAILDKIIKPEHRAKLNTWEEYAKSNDIFGLDCINQIYNTKGTKRLNLNQPSLPRLDMMNTKSSFLGDTDAKLIPTTTTYKFYHGSRSVPKQPKPSIFQFKSLAQIKLSRPLNPMTITFIDNWLQLHDARKYEQAVLSCLRSLTSKLHLADPHSTEMKTRYEWRHDWKLSKPVRMDKAGQDLFAFKPNFAAIQKQEQKKRQHRQKMQELEKSQFAKQLKIFKDFKIN